MIYCSLKLDRTEITNLSSKWNRESKFFQKIWKPPLLFIPIRLYSILQVGRLLWNPRKSLQWCSEKAVLGAFLVQASSEMNTRDNFGVETVPVFIALLTELIWNNENKMSSNFSEMREKSNIHLFNFWKRMHWFLFILKKLKCKF